MLTKILQGKSLVQLWQKMYCGQSQSGTCSQCQHMRIICWCHTPSLCWRSEQVEYRYLRFCQVKDLLEDFIYGMEFMDTVDGDQSLECCPKKHRHHEFVDVKKLTLAHLPHDLRHASVLVWLKYCALLVVKLKRVTSNGKATGRVCFVVRERGIVKTCSSNKCHIEDPHEVYGGISIITNMHVVKNDFDASRTTVEFFYDDKESPPHTEQGSSITLTKREMDYGVFSCYVHNKDLVGKLMLVDEIKHYAWLQIPAELRKISKDYAIIISHPHGESKKFSFGKILDREILWNSEQLENNRVLQNMFNTLETLQEPVLTWFSVFIQEFIMSREIKLPHKRTRYDTATCKGSSGAPVYMGSVVEENGREINLPHTHRGVDREVFNISFT
ncbi:uncharacterized protein LOC131933662 [Physella acuta]|uniref:uncharacterized protein LOC131933662 n=1 Tax=Physella acuta TaxID=109671 RepID=UPI0027DE03F5|nr:uncharacterized protein LOC131933662 [Physella acuta]XP_059146345.1 uncharacterized protein LOC131933662 [Physella acuta]XP_059146374.1 uncharacterized protein LOC131933662 [Physella acuta]